MLPELDAIIQQGRGIYPSIFGSSYDVYRLGQYDAEPIPLVPSVSAEFARITSRNDIEVESSAKALFFTAKLDASRFQPGDIFKMREDSFKADGSIYTMAANRPGTPLPIFAATPTEATLAETESNPAATLTGRVVQSAATASREGQLVCANGSWSFVRGATASKILVGMAMSRLRDFPRSDEPMGAVPDDTRRQTWDAFIPLLPGVTLTTSHVVHAKGMRFEITGVQESNTSFVGQMVMLQRVR